MKACCYSLRAALAYFFLATLLAIATSARADIPTAAGLKPDVRLLIDISGSMKDSDPENLRAPALELIVRLLPEGSKAGVWSFGHEVELLVEHRVIDQAWRDSAIQAVAEIDNSGQLTDIPAALEASGYDFDRLDSSYRTSIILLTDGKVDISESPMTNATAARNLLTEYASNLGAAGIPVHTIALSDEADWGFLHTLAKTTGGIAEQAQTATKLTELFYQSLEMVAPTSRVPVDGKRFDIDPSVHEFTVLMFYDEQQVETGLVSPQGKRYSPDKPQAGVEWFRNRKFALVTVTDPEAGTWSLQVPAATKTRVTVISDLQLEVDPLPHSLPIGKRAELGIRLRERGKVLKDAEFLGVFELSVEIEDPRGGKQIIDVMNDYEVPGDGEFRVVIPGMEVPGRYKVVARLKGETLQRELPMFVEIVATLTNSAISTRGEEIPEQDFQAPLLRFALIFAVAAVFIAWLLRRRKQQKLAVWHGRNLGLANGSGGTDTQSDAVSGMRASDPEPDQNEPHS